MHPSVSPHPPAPTISAGRHLDPAGGACLMELVSVAAGTPWSDRPPCTHPLLSHVARRVNDAVSQEGRQRLLVLIDPLTHAGSADPADVPRLVLACTGVALARRPNPVLRYLHAVAEDRDRSARGTTPTGTAISRALYAHGTAYRSIDVAVYALTALDPASRDRALSEMLLRALRVLVPAAAPATGEGALRRQVSVGAGS